MIYVTDMMSELPPHLRAMVLEIAACTKVEATDVLVEAMRDGLTATYSTWETRRKKIPCPYYSACGCGTQSGPHTCEWRR